MFGGIFLKISTVNGRTVLFDEQAILMGEHKTKLGSGDWQVLDLLLKKHGEVISREELISHAWKGRVVTEASLTQSIFNIRLALGDDGKKQTVLKTIAKIGYIIPAEVILYSESKLTSHSRQWKNPIAVVILIACFFFGIALERPVFESEYFLNNLKKTRVQNTLTVTSKTGNININFLNGFSSEQLEIPKNLELIAGSTPDVYISAGKTYYTFIFDDIEKAPISIGINRTIGLTHAFTQAINLYIEELNS